MSVILRNKRGGVNVKNQELRFMGGVYNRCSCRGKAILVPGSSCTD